MKEGARLFLRGRIWYAHVYDASGRRHTVTTRCIDREAAQAFATRLERELQGAPVADAQVFEVRGAPASFVYFAQAGENGPIKIGRAASPHLRLKNLQSGNGERLRLLAVVPGGKTLESILHVYFGKGRRAGEWFKPTPKLLRLIGEVGG